MKCATAGSVELRLGCSKQLVGSKLFATLTRSYTSTVARSAWTQLSYSRRSILLPCAAYDGQVCCLLSHYCLLPIVAWLLHATMPVAAASDDNASAALHHPSCHPHITVLMVVVVHQAAVGGTSSSDSSSGVLGLHLEGDRFVLDSNNSDAAAALQALADQSASLEGSDSEEQASADVEGPSWDEWLKYFVEADAAAGTQEELRLQMQASCNKWACIPVLRRWRMYSNVHHCSVLWCLLFECACQVGSMERLHNWGGVII